MCGLLLIGKDHSFLQPAELCIKSWNLFFCRVNESSHRIYFWKCTLKQLFCISNSHKKVISTPLVKILFMLFNSVFIYSCYL